MSGVWDCDALQWGTIVPGQGRVIVGCTVWFERIFKKGVRCPGGGVGRIAQGLKKNKCGKIIRNDRNGGNCITNQKLKRSDGSADPEMGT